MRASRLIKMVLLLQARREMTAAELATELEVSERTVARDVLALSEAGVPVYADRGRAGGYRLLGGYRTRLTGMGRSEAEALFLSGVPTALRDMGLEDAASAAKLKVSAALDPALREVHASTAQRFHLDAPGWWQAPATPPLLPVLADAVWSDRVVEVRYARRGTEVERVLEPYGLVLKAGQWYLAARVREEGATEGGPTDGGSTDGGPTVGGSSEGGPTDGGSTARVERAAWRVYRVDRFAEVTGTGQLFVRESDFGLSVFWAERAAAFARALLRTEVTLRLTPAGTRRLPHCTDRTAAEEALAAGTTDEAGRTTVTLRVENDEVAHSQLLALGPECEVLAPAALRARLTTDARRLAALYADEPD